ncbi:hypothetical protein Tco_0975110 [Tanacetum coccineum]|uniref:Uncharacterized protein n=1 Tax=Tanacetum coccineum TaxID=301880 RepID=A0ABQ5EDS5_9ASTR
MWTSKLCWCSPKVHDFKDYKQEDCKGFVISESASCSSLLYSILEPELEQQTRKGKFIAITMIMIPVLRVSLLVYGLILLEKVYYSCSNKSTGEKKSVNAVIGMLHTYVNAAKGSYCCHGYINTARYILDKE